MKVFLKGFFSPLWNSKIATALALSLILVGAAGFFFDGSAERALGERCTAYQCGDCVDNDEDGLTDFDYQGTPRDPDCDSATDDSEGLGGGGGGGGGPGSSNEDGSPLCGFAWGATDEGPKMGVGWVSFNSKDCDTDGDGTFDDGVPGCPASGRAYPYSVSVDDGELEGHAWSNNIGWIQFGDLDVFPTGGHGNNQQNAKISGGVNLSGWARACAGTVNGNCQDGVNGLAMASRNDGWDGWISLKGSLAGLPGMPGSSGTAYGVTFNNSTKKFSGYSWGGEVVGWLKWDHADGSGVRYCDAQNLIALLAADPLEGTVTFDSTLTATTRVALESQRQLAQVADLYSFDCGKGEGWSGSQLFNTYSCTYTVSGWYYPQVKIISGGSTVIGTAEIHALPASGNLGADCSVSPNPLLINQTAEWKATINPQVQTTPPYTYTFSFNDGLSPIVVRRTTGDTNTSAIVNDRTYSVLGNKSVVVNVVDSASPANTGNCTKGIGVIVRPKIIEI